MVDDIENRLLRVEQALFPNEFEDDDFENDDDWEGRWEAEQERCVEECHCGAWKMSSSGEAILIADCCC